MRLKPWQRLCLFVACLSPLLWLGLSAGRGGLGVNPIETVIHASGDWALRFLLLTLALTPLRHWLGWHWLPELRRMLGLYAFFYACLHLLGYVGLDQFFAWRVIFAELLNRPHLGLGLCSFVLLIPLALTSTQAMMRRLGRRWQQLHRLVYLSALSAIAHYLWLVKADRSEPLIYAGVLALLLGWRVWRWRTKTSHRIGDPGLVG